MTVLRCGHMEAHLRPEAGGRISFLRHALAGDLIIPLDSREFDPEFWPKAGGFPLMPFHNRVRAGIFVWNGRQISLPLHPSEPNALHGFASRRRWSCTKIDGAKVVMELTHKGDPSWPWPMYATQEISLGENSVSLTLSVKNLDRKAMPAGLGWHPFIPSPLAISHDAELEWPMAPGYLPTGDCRQRTEATDEAPTRFLSKWSRVGATLVSGSRLEITADPVFSHLVIHEGPAGYACIEPVTHLTNALASPPKSAQDGMHFLVAGETLTGTIILAIAS